MLQRRSLLTIALIFVLPSFARAQEKEKSVHVPKPSEFLGFEVGSDRKLDQASSGGHRAGKKMGCRLTAAQV